MTCTIVSFELLILCNKTDFVMVHHHESEGLVKDWIVVFKVKVLMKVHIFNKCLSGWYLLIC